MLTLNAICCGLNFAFFRGQHCTAVETQVTTMASAALRFTIAVSRNGRLTDMLPLIPGNLTFIREVFSGMTSVCLVHAIAENGLRGQRTLHLRGDQRQLHIERRAVAGAARDRNRAAMLGHDPLG